MVDAALRYVQRAIVMTSAAWHRRRAPTQRADWVVGPAEIASLVANLAAILPHSISVNLASHRFYDFDYDYTVEAGRGDWLRRRFVVPWWFGRLAAEARGFVYVGADGFLLAGDDRAWEFGFLKRRGCRVVCVFTGSDIRSPALMRAFEARTGLETIVTYLDQVAPVFGTQSFDDQRRRTAAVAEAHADAIFNAPVDQMSYLERPVEPFPYLYPEDAMLDDMSKHATPGPRIVLHVPSSPIIKGTQVVRAAVRRLLDDGMVFEYRELIDVPHHVVLAALRESHIVLNEFYAFVPGVFGVEAMANGCALLTRADEHIETSLPAGSNDAWLVTPASDIERNLRGLLESPERIAAIAARGQSWVRAHATSSATGDRVRRVLDSL